ncbi:MAG TPA: SRPBCC family protein [Micrococcaceae bacterium]|jgi:hypothetical protein
MAGSTDYEFQTLWRVPGTTLEVAEILGDPEALQHWWPSVYLGIRLIDPGAPDGTGRTVDLFTKGWLPYTLQWTMTVTESITEAGFAITAEGDLIGTGRWVFRQEGPETVVRYDWRVSASKPLLRRLSWLLKPAFSANHRWAMARGEESLVLELRRRRAAGPDGPGKVPAPPGPTFRGPVFRALRRR